MKHSEDLSQIIEAKFAEQTEEFAAGQCFVALETGRAGRQNYDRFIADLCRTHLKSPHILAFLFSVSPPAAASNLRHNLLEELGLDDDGGISHPAMLLELASAAGFDRSARRELERSAQEELRRIICDPIMFGTLKEIGLSVLLETIAFEWMLSRLAGRMGRFLAAHRGLSGEDLRWFAHHSEVDIRHAEEGLEAVADYIVFYGFDRTDAEEILDVTFRENVFTKRYFGEMALARETGVFG
ncbi:MAG: iron-containing redox enzyme family protein [Pyrinomonadaceae bacterium]